MASEFVELILHSRLPVESFDDPTSYLNFNYRRRGTVYERLEQPVSRLSRLGRYVDMCVEVGFFLKNKQSDTLTLVESWLIYI